MSAIPLEDGVYYPESDGKPVAETEIHLEELIYVWQGLKDHFAALPDVFVGANLFLYFRRGDPGAVVAPDCFVVKGVPKRPPGSRGRRKYLLWEEGPAPCFVLETTSKSTRREDQKSKLEVYEQLGVEEYFLFDPLGEYLKPRLQGFRLMAGRYQPVRPLPDGALLSRSTGVVFRPEGPGLRLTDAATGAPLLRKEEEAEVRHQAEEGRRQAEEAYRQADEARRQAEERARALEDELARLGPLPR